MPDSAAANPFAYGGDDPLTETDPSGHCPVDLCGFNMFTHKVNKEAMKQIARRDSCAPYPTCQALAQANARAWRIGVQRERAIRAAEARAAAERAKKQQHHSWWGGVWNSVKHVAHAAAKVAVTVTKVAYQMSGAADVVGCVTHPTLMGCIQGALAIASVIPVVGEAGMAFRAASMVRKAAEIGNRMLPFLQSANEAIHGNWRGALETAAIGVIAGKAGKLAGKVAGRVAKAAGQRLGSALGRDAKRTLTDAEEATLRRSKTEAGRTEGDGGPSCSAKPHSFTAATPVLMADGSAKPIGRIKIGNKIANSVPGDSDTQAHTVTNVIVTKTDHDFVDLTIGTSAKDGKNSKNGKSSTLGKLTTTFHHPFYDITQAAFVDAQNLKPGDELQTTDTAKPGTPASGTGATRAGPVPTVTVLAVHLYHADTVTYDLTIGDLHTYYVEAGSTPVLVLNCGYEQEAQDAQARAAELKRQWTTSTNYNGGTVSVIGVRNIDTGQIVNRIAVNGNRRMPKWILGAGEEFVRGRGHAEETIFKGLADNQEVPYGGTSRNVCQDTCLPFIKQWNLRLGGQLFRGDDDKTGYRAFWRDWRY